MNFKKAVVLNSFLKQFVSKPLRLLPTKSTSSYFNRCPSSSSSSPSAFANALSNEKSNLPSWLIAASIAAPSLFSTLAYSADDVEKPSGELLCAFVNEKGPGKSVSEDVHFINADLGVLAVFDGVGGWKGITNPEAFPRALRDGLDNALKLSTPLHTSTPHAHISNPSPLSINVPTQSQSPISLSHKSHHVQSAHHPHNLANGAPSPESLHSSVISSSPASLSPRHLLSRAHDFAQEQLELGSSTACIIVVDKDNAKFDSANLGDSGWYLFRSSTKKIEEWSEEQQHYWNCPYQIGGSKSKADKVDMADLRADISLDDGDVLLLATDGLSDNLFRDEINGVIQKKFHIKLSSDELKEIAQDLYKAAQKKFNSLDNTPFREHYYKHTKKHQRHPNYFEGSYGKPDDLCVIIAQYSKNNRMENKLKKE